MKMNTKTLALMAALAAGTASAAVGASVDRTGNLTNAGTTITNVATATFDDPSTGTPVTPIPSNPVTTTVQEKQAFDITYTTGADSDSTDTAAGADSAYKLTNVRPGDYVAFEYVAVNNGNAKQTITLSTAVDQVVAGTVKYYLPTGSFSVDPKTGVVTNGTDLTAGGNKIDVMPSGDDPATGAVESNTGMQTFWMVYQVPQIAHGTSAGATPIGTALVWNGSANVSATEQKDPAAPAYDDLFWQYNQVTAVTPSIPTTPLYPDPNDPNTPKTVRPPTNVGQPPAVPGNPVSPPGTPGDPPTDPKVPGYPDPNNSKTAIEIDGDNQIAYPPADNNTADDSVTFENLVTNGSTLADTVTLSVVAYDGTQVVTRVSATQYTIKDTSGNVLAKVTLSTGTLALTATGTSNAAGQYQVTVTYLDNDLTDAQPVRVKIGVDSGNDGSDTTPDDYTTDTVMPPSMQFGDPKTGVAADPALVPVEVKKPGETATFPMQVANTGEYNDTYTLSGYVVVPLSDGTQVIVPVNYSGAGVQATGGTRLVKTDLNNDGTIGPIGTGETVEVPYYITNVVGANTELAVNADIVVPSGAAYAPAGLPVQQEAKANYSGIALTDTNDLIKISLINGVNVAKFAYDGTTAANTITKNGIDNPTGYSDVTAARPGDTVKYQIIAKNNYNIAVKKFFLKDTVPTNTEFVSVTGVSSAGGTLIYSTDGTTWSLTAPTSGTDFYVAVDDAAAAGEQLGSIASGATLSMTFEVKVK